MRPPSPQFPVRFDKRRRERAECRADADRVSMARYFWALLGSGIHDTAKPRQRRAGGLWQTHVWDAENRLIRIEPAGSPQDGSKRIEFAYDYLCR